jgi:hypothetical protein
MHLAVGIFDRVIVSNMVELEYLEVMNLPLVILTCVIIAAKVEQPLTPSIKMTVKLFPESEKALLTKDRVISLETKFLIAMDFDLHILSPLTFLDRFLRLSNLAPNHKVC